MALSTEISPTGSAFSQQELARMSRGMQRHTSREVERVVSKAIVADAYEQGRALVTGTALQNVGALTAMEQHLIQIAPLGEERYRAIVDGYAMGAARSLARW